MKPILFLFLKLGIIPMTD